MTTRRIFDYPHELVLDEEFNFILNLPAELQGQPGWFDTDPSRYARLVEQRQVHGVLGIEDFTTGIDQEET